MAARPALVYQSMRSPLATNGSTARLATPLAPMPPPHDQAQMRARRPVTARCASIHSTWARAGAAARLLPPLNSDGQAARAGLPGQQARATVRDSAAAVRESRRRTRRSPRYGPALRFNVLPASVEASSQLELGERRQSAITA